MFFKFLAEIRLRTPLKSPHKVLDPDRAIFIPPAPCLKSQSESCGSIHKSAVECTNYTDIKYDAQNIIVVDKKQCSSGFWPRYASERH